MIQLSVTIQFEWKIYVRILKEGSIEIEFISYGVDCSCLMLSREEGADNGRSSLGFAKYRIDNGHCDVDF